MKTAELRNSVKYVGLLAIPIMLYILLRQTGFSPATIFILPVGLILVPIITTILLAKIADKTTIETSLVLVWMILMFMAFVNGILGQLVANVNSDIIHPVIQFSIWKMPLIMVVVIVVLHVVSLKQVTYTNSLSMLTVLFIVFHLIYNVVLIIMVFSNFVIVD